MHFDLSNLSDAEWWTLRNIVCDAATDRTLRPEAATLSQHPVVVLVQRYLADRQDRFIDEAAKMVALARPGIDPKAVEQHYWLVIDKA